MCGLDARSSHEKKTRIDKMRATKIWTVLAVCGGLAACGDTTGEQALLGGAAGVGTAVLLNGNPVVGLAAGAAANVLYCKENPRKCN
ncbi:MAG: osmotically inducible lipoprotein OsmB [Paracoccaceae bacterium]